MNEIQFNEISDWQKQTFGQSTPLSKIAHLAEELEELVSDIKANNSERRLEFADCFFLLFGAAAADGMTYQDICQAIQEKFEINKARKWGKPDDNGVVKHIAATNPASCQNPSRSVYIGRVVKVQKDFSFVKDEIPFNSLYEAENWLREQGYVYGSLCGDSPIAIKKGKDFSYYDLPEKWKDFSDEDKAYCDGVLISQDFRNCPVKVFLFN